MSRERRLIAALVELADTLVDGYDPLELLYVLAERAVDLLGATAAGVLVMDQAGQMDLVAASSADMRALELLEAQVGQGPCVDAWRTAETVNVADIGEHVDRWPRFAPRAAERGFVAALGQPLHLRGRRIGALDVFRDRAGPFDADEIALALGLADMATIGMLHARALDEARDQIRNLEHALATRAVVEQATTLLAERLGLDAGDAFDRLRRFARTRNLRLRDVASRVVEGELDQGTFREEGSAP